MKVAFILSGLPDGLQCLDRNRERVASKLKQYDWEVRVATFYSLAVLQSYIDEFKDKYIEDFIFFYTGHGDSSSSDGILTLKLHDRTPVDLNTLYNSYFSQLNPRRKAIILDACYSGNFEGRNFHDTTEYLCSSDFDEESYEDANEDGLNHSYFSYYFCEALDNLEGMVTLEVINEKYLKPNVDVQNSKYISIDSKMVIVDKDKFRQSDKSIKNQELVNIIVMKKSLEERHVEIENYIISNELIMATKLIVNFVSDFSNNRRYKIEALGYQSSINSLNEEIRKYGKSSEMDIRIKQLRNSLFELMEVVINKKIS